MSKYDYDLPFVEEKDDIVVLKHLTKHFPVATSLTGKVLVSVKAVNDVSLRIKKGTTLGVVGESGCGKTTLGRTMLRLYDITSGEVIYRGLSLDRLSTDQLKVLLPDEDEAYKAKSREEIMARLEETGVDISRANAKILQKLRPDIQIIFQDPYSSLSPRMTVGEIIGEAVREHEIVPRSEHKEYVLKIMKECGLQTHYYERYPHEFSGGQRQRIVLARALMHQPRILFLDEATSAMDNVSQKAVKKNMDALGITRISIAHRLSTVMDCDRILVMDHGQIVEQGNFQELMDQNGLFASMARRNLV